MTPNLKIVSVQSHVYKDGSSLVGLGIFLYVEIDTVSPRTLKDSTKF